MGAIDHAHAALAELGEQGVIAEGGQRRVAEIEVDQATGEGTRRHRQRSRLARSGCDRAAAERQPGEPGQVLPVRIAALAAARMPAIAHLQRTASAPGTGAPAREPLRHRRRRQGRSGWAAWPAQPRARLAKPGECDKPRPAGSLRGVPGASRTGAARRRRVPSRAWRALPRYPSAATGNAHGWRDRWRAAAASHPAPTLLRRAIRAASMPAMSSFPTRVIGITGARLASGMTSRARRPHAFRPGRS